MQIIYVKDSIEIGAGIFEFKRNNLTNKLQIKRPLSFIVNYHYSKSVIANITEFREIIISSRVEFLLKRRSIKILLELIEQVLLRPGRLLRKPFDDNVQLIIHELMCLYTEEQWNLLKKFYPRYYRAIYQHNGREMIKEFIRNE